MDSISSQGLLTQGGCLAALLLALVARLMYVFDGISTFFSVTGLQGPE